MRTMKMVGFDDEWGGDGDKDKDDYWGDPDEDGDGADNDWD
jgi:hypothetical protein